MTVKSVGLSTVDISLAFATANIGSLGFIKKRRENEGEKTD